jgi:hypothetical protein
MAEIDDNAHLKSGTGTHIFRLKGLQTKVFLNQNPNYAPYDTPPVSASYFMDISINSLLLDDLIFISAASNYIDNSKWPDISFSLGKIHNSSKTDIDTYFVDHITKKIGPAWLAKNITGGYNNSDIFHNENELVQQYVDMDKTINNLNYLQISPTDLSNGKKLALNNISITDITINAPVTLYSPDASGADFVTPGWTAGYDPSYALTASDSEYLLYDMLDPSGVFIKYGFHTELGHAYRINIDCCNNDTDYNSHINVSIIDSANNKPLYLHYDDENENVSSLDSSNILQIHDGTNILDASTNIVFYDNTIKSQLIKVLKRGGTSEANPLNATNLTQYYISKYNLGREIMLSMFASGNEKTINRINDILTYQPPPIVYDVTLGDGYKGDNSGNKVFFLNGAETPVLNLTRGLDYEFNINGTDISKNKFIFTKDRKTDGVDICLNPIDYTKVITAGLTYEINNTSVNFQEFNKQYETTFDVLHYIDFRPLINGTLPPTINTNNNVDRWCVSNVRLFNITTNTYVTEIYPPTDTSGIDHISQGAILTQYDNAAIASTIGDPNEVFSDNITNYLWPDYINFHNNFTGEPFIRYAVYINPDHEYRVHVSSRNDNISYVHYTNVDILDQNFNKILTVNPNSGFYVYGSNSNGNRAKDASGIFQINPTNHVYPSDIVERPRDVVTQRKIKWSIPFNEVNVPSNSFYDSDISDNLGGNVIINKNPIYGAMKFIDGDVIQFHLDYSQKSIVDASGVALDSSGNKLGSKPIEDQDYIVRLNVHDLYHYPKLKAMSYDNSDNLITDTNSLTSYYDFSKKYQFSAGTNDTTRNWKNWVTLLDSSGIYLNNEASGNILGLQFSTTSDEFGIGISTDICNNIWEEKPWEINEAPTDVSMISSNKFIWAFDASLNGNDYKYKIADTGGVIQDIDDTKLHNQKYNWIIDIKSDGKLCLKTSTDSSLNVISSYSNIQLDSDTRYYLWIGSKDPSFNFTNMKYLPETRIYDDEITLGPVVKTYSQGSTTSYNPYNVVDQTEVTYNLSTADVIYLVTQASNKIYINGIRYNEAAPLVLVGPGGTTPGNTYRFNLINETNLNTRLVFSSSSDGTGELSDGITYNGTAGVYDTTQGSRDRVPYVDINTNDLTDSTLYYYDASAVNTDISGTIVVKTPNEITVTVAAGIFNLTPNNSLVAGEVYRFIQSDPTNASHPFRISLTEDGSEYTTNVSYIGTPGQPGSYTELIVPSDYNSGDLYYKCQNHSGMGAAFT